MQRGKTPTGGYGCELLEKLVNRWIFKAVGGSEWAAILAILVN